MHEKRERNRMIHQPEPKAWTWLLILLLLYLFGQLFYFFS
ncbi:PLDc N-terminal domain-containing protein [Legionella oakridgensis]